MPEKKGKTRKDQLPLCAYLSFPFGSSDSRSKDIFLEDLLTHRCPRIFDVGVLLLEIGLGEKFRTGNKRDLVAQLNLNHKIATDSLEELEKATWDGFLNKKVFDQAVKFCLHSTNFIKASKEAKANRLGVMKPPEPLTAEEQRRGVIERRKNLLPARRPAARVAGEGGLQSTTWGYHLRQHETPGTSTSVDRIRTATKCRISIPQRDRS
jgi:hypothetical protein